YQIATRKAGHADRAMTSLFYSTLVGAILASPLAPVGWVMPDIGALGLFALMGAMGAGGHLLLTQAHRLAPASTLAPFVYTQILWMILAGFVVFGDVPGLWTLTGAAIVILSGIYLYHREWQKTR
ncbi:MAG TPA: DMT family transporter, partial [Rhizobiales bacterium]|nr:DMT family transporter [Hyphomicrobiales bacterium]